MARLVVGGGSKLDTEREPIEGGSARRSAEREYNPKERELQTLATVTAEEGENRIRLIRECQTTIDTTHVLG